MLNVGYSQECSWQKNKRLVITVKMLFLMSKTLVKMAINRLCLNK